MKTHSISILKLVVLSSLFTGGAIFANPATCADAFVSVGREEQPLGAASARRPLATIKKLRFMAFNMENFFLVPHKYREMMPDHSVRIEDIKVKPEAQLLGAARAITDADPDFIVVEEVDDLSALETFSKKYLNGAYRPFLIEGNDPRYIDIGFLVKADLPLQIEERTNKTLTWYDPVEKRETPLFSRDLPVLIVRREGAKPNETPLFVFVGNHGKSKRDRDGDPNSTIWRTAQYEAAGKIIDGLFTEFGKNLPLILGGDFNTAFPSAPELAPLKKRLQDPFDLLKIPVKDRITHSFPHFHGSPEYQQLDNLLVSPPLASSVLGVQVYHYKDENGNVKPLPRTFDDRDENPSDHFPLIMDLSTETILPEAYPVH
ncbi:MAG: endonuclease/exonuclease/phosphatase family protein [Pseudobdellovibrionaceae bacterium]